MSVCTHSEVYGSQMKLNKTTFKQKSETRITANILKQDPNTWKFQKNAIYYDKNNPQIFRVIPLSSYKTTKPNQTKPFSAKPLLLAMHRASEGHFSSYTWRKTWLPVQHISHYNSRRKGEVGEMVEENMSTCTVYLSLYLYISVSGGGGERERERESITKSKHVLVWKLLLQIFTHLRAFSRPAWLAWLIPTKCNLIIYIFYGKSKGKGQRVCVYGGGGVEVGGCSPVQNTSHDKSKAPVEGRPCQTGRHRQTQMCHQVVQYDTWPKKVKQ